MADGRRPSTFEPCFWAAVCVSTRSLVLGRDHRSKFFDPKARVTPRRLQLGEESPDTIGQDSRQERLSRRVDRPQGHRAGTLRLKPGHRGPHPAVTESVTENRPPGGQPSGKGEKVGQEPTARTARFAAGKTQSGARQNRRLGGPSNSRGYAAFRFRRKAAQAAREMVVSAARRTESGLRPQNQGSI